ncbi:MAG: lipid-A-disaccharide synthase [Planctomycetota bacterium]
MPRIFMSAGEPSGVAIGATLMRTLKRRVAGVSFAGLGGPAMVEHGLDQIYDPARTATMWLWGNLKRLPIPVVHFVSSQFWARRYYTLEPIRRAFSHVLCIHEFEKRYYDEAGIPATFVGHPLFERLENRPTDRTLLGRLGAMPAPRLGLLPGSRHAEILGNLPVMLRAARRLEPRPSLLVSAARGESKAFVEEQVRRSGLEHEVVDLGSGEILQSADLSLITSGSASMEAVYYGCPAVVVYRLSPLSYFFAKPHITCAIAQPNLVAGREILPEFLLVSAGGKRVSAAAQRLLDREAERETQRREFAAIRERLLRGPPASEAAADVVQSHLP